MSMNPLSRFASIAVAAVVVAMLPAQAATASDLRVRVGVLKFGTVNWELDAIRAHRLAEREGIDLQVVELGSKRATSVALQGGGADVIVTDCIWVSRQRAEGRDYAFVLYSLAVGGLMVRPDAGVTDVIVTDWIWVSRQRAEGRDYAFVPYSLAVGGLMVRPDAGVTELGDLRGRKVGVAGGPVDKSWLLLRAYAKRAGVDLSESVEPTFGAPPLLNELIKRGELPAVLNFWHYNARLEAAGMQALVTVSEILPALGVERPIPLLGWVFDHAWADEHREALHGFLRASYAAKHMLLESDEEWTRLASRMKVSDPTTAAALRDAWRAGVPRSFDAADREAAARTFAILAREGGAEFVGSSGALAPGTFWTGFDPAQWQR